MKFPAHEALTAQTGFLLRKVSTATFERFSAVMARHGLHPMHFGMLLIIDAEEPVSQQELSARSRIDPSTMVARMDTLVERGLVERARGTADRRTYEIRLSAQGRELLGILGREARDHGDRFFAPLTADERATLHALLAKLAASLDDPPSTVI